MQERGWYNGYGWTERYAKLKALRREAPAQLAPLQPPCQLCADPSPKSVEYHDEDYSKPYCWKPPAIFVLCRNCHRTHLHKRFTRPHAWSAFLAHVKRGGYARDLVENHAVKREVRAYARALAEGRVPSPMSAIPGRAQRESPTWYEALSVDPVQTTPDGKRPRP